MEVHKYNVDSWHYTKSKLIKFRHLWKIDNFLLIDNEITSQEFASDSFMDRKWKLRIKKGDFMFLELKLVSTDNPDFKYSWKTFVMNADDEECHSKGSDYMFHTEEGSLFYERFISLDYLRDESKRMLHNGALVLVTQISMLSEKVEITSGNCLNCLHKSKEPDHFGELLNSGLHSDIIFVIDKEEIQAHKAILAIHSNVFKAMFEHKQLEENKTNRVVVNDVEPDVFKEVLRFIYSRKCEKINQIAPELFTVADKYDLKQLKAICVSHMEKKLSVDTVISTLVLADLHGLNDMKKKSLDYIKENVLKVTSLSEWTEMIKQYPHLVTLVVQHMADMYSKK
ncbi:speckle-type POZ protein-like [Haematobia irritans]|uniref:speckle-type POZ protein-like n=1 Tax=Haematobia irritans TaxID=7368 RepID=UPI003F50690D